MLLESVFTNEVNFITVYYYFQDSYLGKYWFLLKSSQWAKYVPSLLFEPINSLSQPIYSLFLHFFSL